MFLLGAIFVLGYFSLDFAFPEKKVCIECDRDYFHSNPKIYKNGPQTEIKKNNFKRDQDKNIFLEKEGWTIIRIWESDINSGNFIIPLLKFFKQQEII